MPSVSPPYECDKGQDCVPQDFRYGYVEFGFDQGKGLGIVDVNETELIGMEKLSDID